jgi:hypothetical protein
VADSVGELDGSNARDVEDQEPIVRNDQTREGLSDLDLAAQPKISSRRGSPGVDFLPFVVGNKAQIVIEGQFNAAVAGTAFAERGRNLFKLANVLPCQRKLLSRRRAKRGR